MGILRDTKVRLPITKRLVYEVCKHAKCFLDAGEVSTALVHMPTEAEMNRCSWTLERLHAQGFLLKEGNKYRRNPAKTFTDNDQWKGQQDKDGQ